MHLPIPQGGNGAAAPALAAAPTAPRATATKTHKTQDDTAVRKVAADAAMIIARIRMPRMDCGRYFLHKDISSGISSGKVSGKQEVTWGVLLGICVEAGKPAAAKIVGAVDAELMAGQISIDLQHRLGTANWHIKAAIEYEPYITAFMQAGGGSRRPGVGRGCGGGRGAAHPHRQGAHGQAAHGPASIP